MTSGFLSYQLEMYPDTLQYGFEADTGGAAEPKPSLLLGKYVREAVSSLEGFTGKLEKAIVDWLQRDPEEWRYFVDDFYSHEVVANIPRMVSRFVRLCPALAGVIPSGEVSVYLREATRCFIYGFFQASIALCRAALEAGLNEHLERRLGAVPAQDLVDKIDAAQRLRLISGQGAHLAHEVRTTARSVLHRKPVKSNLAFDTLVQSRGFLKELYER